MGMQQERAVTPVSQYAMRRHTFNIRTCVAHVFVTCTCAFTLLLWAKEQPSRLALNSENPQQRLLKCFSKPTVMKTRAGWGVWGGIRMSERAECRPSVTSCPSYSANATQSTFPGPLLHCRRLVEVRPPLQITNTHVHVFRKKQCWCHAAYWLTKITARRPYSTLFIHNRNSPVTFWWRFICGWTHVKHLVSTTMFSALKRRMVFDLQVRAEGNMRARTQT